MYLKFVSLFQREALRSIAVFGQAHLVAVFYAPLSDPQPPHHLGDVGGVDGCDGGGPSVSGRNQQPHTRTSRGFRTNLADGLHGRGGSSTSQQHSILTTRLARADDR